MPPVLAGALIGLGLTLATTGAGLDPTVAGALIAAGASVGNTLILVRHERKVNRRLDERRLVVTHTDDGVFVSDEERRELADRRAARARTVDRPGRRRRARRHKGDE